MSYQVALLLAFLVENFDFGAPSSFNLVNKTPLVVPNISQNSLNVLNGGLGFLCQ